ncbi:MAG: 1,4-alpha-glucan branching enzyme, partial [Burkholderiaceae bacterium]|nr:1,4-alpha-glucan branching enzyme [Burkholderiaceae bacterium]
MTATSKAKTAESADLELIAALRNGRLADPFAFLGPHRTDRCTIVRSFQPGAQRVEVIGRDCPLEDNAPPIATLHDMEQSGLFVGMVPDLVPGVSYLLRISWPGPSQRGEMQVTEDPYAFPLLLGEMDLHLFSEGKHRELGRCLGAQPMVIDSVPGTRFAVWAPNAMRVSVVGDFNQWDGRRHPMRLRPEAGVWEL